MENTSQKIARLNDAFRKSGQGGRIYATSGIQALPPRDQFEILNLVRTFNDFSEGNDPYGEHDFGSFEFKGDKVFWKIDYFDPDMQHGSEDPADAKDKAHSSSDGDESPADDEAAPPDATETSVQEKTSKKDNNSNTSSDILGRFLGDLLMRSRSVSV